MLVFNEIDALTQYTALMKFLIQNKDRPVATREVSQATLEDHVVQVVCSDEKGVSRATGFLVTNGGFVVTARHVIRHYEDVWRSINKRTPPPEEGLWIRWLREYASKNYIEYRDRQFPLDISVWNDDPQHDVVVLKAVVYPETMTASQVKDEHFWRQQNREVPFLHRGHLKGDLLPEHEEVEIYGLRTRGVSPQFARITHPEWIAKLETGKVRDMFLTDAYIQPGYSGAPVLDSQGYCVGMASFSIPPGGKHPRSERYQRGYAGCAPFSKIWTVLKSVADDLQEQTRTIRHR